MTNTANETTRLNFLDELILDPNNESPFEASHIGYLAAGMVAVFAGLKASEIKVPGEEQHDTQTAIITDAHWQLQQISDSANTLKANKVSVSNAELTTARETLQHKITQAESKIPSNYNKLLDGGLAWGTGILTLTALSTIVAIRTRKAHKRQQVLDNATK